MAVNSRDKRFSMIGLDLPFGFPVANPSGTIDNPARQMLLMKYSGIAFSGAPAPTVGGQKIRGFIANMNRLMNP